jgi:hypothetical protein
MKWINPAFLTPRGLSGRSSPQYPRTFNPYVLDANNRPTNGISVPQQFARFQVEQKLVWQNESMLYNTTRSCSATSSSSALAQKVRYGKPMSDTGAQFELCGRPHSVPMSYISPDALDADAVNEKKSADVLRRWLRRRVSNKARHCSSDETWGGRVEPLAGRREEIVRPVFLA